MKSQTLLFSLIVMTLLIGPLFASTNLSSGNYQAQISPNVDSHMASNIEKGLDSIQEIDQISVNSSDSSVHFHVKNGQSVDFARLQNVLQAADPNAQFQQLVLQTGPNTTTGTSGTSVTSVANGASTFVLVRGTATYVCTAQP